MDQSSQVDAACREAAHIYLATNRREEGACCMDHQQLLLDMHGDLKVVKEGVHEAKEVALATRHDMMAELVALRRELAETRKCVSNHRNEITRIKTVFGIISGVFTALGATAIAWLSNK